MNYWINIVGSAFIGAAIGGCGDIALTYCQDCYQYVSQMKSDPHLGQVLISAPV